MPGPDVAVNARAPFPHGADDHADGRQLILGLDESEILPARVRINPHAIAEALVGIHYRRRGRDRVPGGDRRPRIHTSEPCGGIAVYENMSRGLVELRHPAAAEDS